MRTAVVRHFFDRSAGFASVTQRWSRIAQPRRFASQFGKECITFLCCGVTRSTVPPPKNNEASVRALWRNAIRTRVRQLPPPVSPSCFTHHQLRIPRTTPPPVTTSLPRGSSPINAHSISISTYLAERGRLLHPADNTSHVWAHPWSAHKVVQRARYSQLRRERSAGVDCLSPALATAFPYRPTSESSTIGASCWNHMLQNRRSRSKQRMR